MSVPVPAKQTFTGSCHCGFIKYTAALPVTDTPVATRCNCTVCLKRGYTTVHVAPDDFKLLAPSSKAEVSNYQMRSKDINKYFCGTCGIHCWSDGKFVYEGTAHQLFTINILTLDVPQDGLDLKAFKIQYVDGRHDNWMQRSEEPIAPGMI